MDQEISSHLLKLRRTNPFLATISLFARYKFDDRVEQFETDGIYISINPDYFLQLQDKEKTGVLLHVTLHTALLHPQRIALRNASIWNIAADIVVNNIIVQSGDFQVPPQTAHEPKYKDLSVEQVYEALSHLPNKSNAVKQAALKEPDPACSASGSGKNQSASENGQGFQPDNTQPVEKSGSVPDQQPKAVTGPSNAQIQTVLEKLYPARKDLVSAARDSGTPKTGESDKLRSRQYWQNAFRKADVAQRFGCKQQGNLPAGLLRELDRVLNAELDWRWILWNFVVRTPTDFEGFDRRFVHQGLYLDKLESDRLNVLVAVDTSGSIDEDELTRFISELAAITSAYHVINVILYFVDADIYGPYELEKGIELSTPEGGGGTDFSVFFATVVDQSDHAELDVIVYFTDGYGEFPEGDPAVETLWVVTSGGLESEQFPFGQVARLAS
jgi:predicted metal-dependent peptidase